MRIFIAGGGSIGLQFARQLSAEQDIVVIESDPEAARRFSGLDVQVIRGSAASIELLRGLGLCAEDEFIACSVSDETNLVACLAAKQVAPVRTFCFVSKQVYYDSFRSGDGEGSVIGIDHIIWPQHLLAEEISRIVLVPEAIDVEIFAEGRVYLLEYRLQDDSSLVGVEVQHLNFPRGTLVVARVRDDTLHVPRGDTTFSVGDKIVFMGKRRPLATLAQKYLGRERARVEDVTIVGGGNVGLALAKILEGGLGVRLKLIELSHERCEQIAAQVPHATVLHGDGTNVALLQEEQINASDVLVSVTSDDDKNLLCSLLARQMGIPKIVTRVNTTANLKLFEGVGIDVPLNPRVTAVNAVLNFLRGSGAQLVATIEHGQAHVLDLVVPDDFPVTEIRKTALPPGVIIGAILRGYRTIVPKGDDYIEPGDHLLVLTTERAREAMQDFF
jgi:trk system potassium uptake protein TrkA